MKKYKFILLVIIISIIPLLFTTTLPYVLHSRLNVNSMKMGEYANGIFHKQYIVSLQRGNIYTITVTPSSNMNVAIRRSDSPYMMSGYGVDGNTGGSYETMHFFAARGGEIYIQIVTKGSGYFNIIISTGVETDPPTGIVNQFYDGTYLLILILPSVAIILIGIIINKLKVKRKKRIIIVPRITTTTNPYKEEKKEEKESVIEKKVRNFCQFCGSAIKESLKECTNCNCEIY